MGLQRRGQRITVPVRKLFSREKRPYGLGMVGRLTNRTYRKRIDSYVKQQIEDMDDHRWVPPWRPAVPLCPLSALQLSTQDSSPLFSLQAVLHVLGHLCALAHHGPDSVHLWNCPCGVLTA